MKKNWNGISVITAAFIGIIFFSVPAGYAGHADVPSNTNNGLLTAGGSENLLNPQDNHFRSKPPEQEDLGLSSPLTGSAASRDNYTTTTADSRLFPGSREGFSEPGGNPKKMIALSVMHLMKDEKVWRSYKKMEKQVFDYVSIDYFKPFDKKNKPGARLKSDVPQKGVGFSLYPKLDTGQLDNLGMRASFLYSDTALKCSVDLQETVSVEMLNHTLNNFIGATTSLGMSGSATDTAVFLKLNLPF